MGGVGMKIPEWVDNRVVFALVFTLGIDDLARSTGLPIGLMEFVLVPLVGTALVLLAFLVWRALCRLAARMFGANPSSQRCVISYIPEKALDRDDRRLGFLLLPR